MNKGGGRGVLAGGEALGDVASDAFVCVLNKAVKKIDVAYCCQEWSVALLVNGWRFGLISGLPMCLLICSLGWWMASFSERVGVPRFAPFC